MCFVVLKTVAFFDKVYNFATGKFTPFVMGEFTFFEMGGLSSATLFSNLQINCFLNKGFLICFILNNGFNFLQTLDHYVK